MFLPIYNLFSTNIMRNGKMQVCEMLWYWMRNWKEMNIGGYQQI
jgi:hypothetical protein